MSETAIPSRDLVTRSRSAPWAAQARIASGLDALAPLLGIAALFVMWWLAGLALAASPRLSAFTGFAPGPAMSSFWHLVYSGEAWHATAPSLARILAGLGIALAVGAPIGLVLGLVPLLDKALQLPFQMLRMISPLSWMPIAILAFPTWDGAIVFLIAAASIWPIVFATAAGVKRIDPAWVSAGRTLGGRGFELVQRVVAPAVLPDLLTGLRLALGTAWIVIVPAEFLGVTSGLGYAINDARDTLSYDRLAALVLLIGLIGFALDFVLSSALKRLSWTPSA
jgi:NitT/TauT family transport system permease protein